MPQAFSLFLVFAKLASVVTRACYIDAAVTLNANAHEAIAAPTTCPASTVNDTTALANVKRHK